MNRKVCVFLILMVFCFSGCSNYKNNSTTTNNNPNESDVPTSTDSSIIQENTAADYMKTTVDQTFSNSDFIIKGEIIGVSQDNLIVNSVRQNYSRKMDIIQVKILKIYNKKDIINCQVSQVINIQVFPTTSQFFGGDASITTGKEMIIFIKKIVINGINDEVSIGHLKISEYIISHPDWILMKNNDLYRVSYQYESFLEKYGFSPIAGKTASKNLYLYINEFELENAILSKLRME